MRFVLLIAGLIFSYLILRGWPESWDMPLRAGLALIVIMLAIPHSDVSKKVSTRTKLRAYRLFQWMDYLYMGIVIICIQLLLLCVFTLGPELAEDSAESLHEIVFRKNSQSTADPSNSSSQAPENLDSGSMAGSWIWDRSGRRELPTSSHIKLGNRPEIFLDMLSEAAAKKLNQSQIYVHSYALDHFDGKKWSVHRPSKFTQKTPAGRELTINEKSAKDLPIYKHTVTQSHHSRGHNVFNALQHPLRTSIAMLTKVSSDTYMLPAVDEGKSGYQYEVVSQPLIFDQIIASDPDIQSGTVDSVYLSQVNNSMLQGKISQFAARVPKGQSLEKTLKSLRELIRRQCRYTLKMNNKKGVNALENFLFHERAGYCIFYATATAMICREHGIPSRIALGWTGGFHHIDTPYISFREKHSHAWAEIYLQGYGWVVFDTTPEAEIRPGHSVAGDAAPDPEGFFADYDSEHPPTVPADDEGYISWKTPLLIIGLGSLLVISLLMLRRRASPSYHGISPQGFALSPPPYLLLFSQLSSQLGYPIQPGTTLLQNITILQQANLTSDALATADLPFLLEYHYNVTYRGYPHEEASEAKIKASLKAAMLAQEKSPLDHGN